MCQRQKLCYHLVLSQKGKSSDFYSFVVGILLSHVLKQIAFELLYVGMQCYVVLHVDFLSMNLRADHYCTYSCSSIVPGSCHLCLLIQR